MKADKKEIMALELADWKEIETGAENEICHSRKAIAIAKVLLGTAEIRIKQLGGKTNDELDEEAKQDAKRPQKATTG